MVDRGMVILILGYVTCLYSGWSTEERKSDRFLDHEDRNYNLTQVTVMISVSILDTYPFVLFSSLTVEMGPSMETVGIIEYIDRPTPYSVDTDR